MLFSGRMSIITLHGSPAPGLGARLSLVSTMGFSPSGSLTTAPTLSMSMILLCMNSCLSGSCRQAAWRAEWSASNGCNLSYHTRFSTQWSTHLDTPGPSSCNFFHAFLADFECRPPALKWVGSVTLGRGSHRSALEKPPSSNKDTNRSPIASTYFTSSTSSVTKKSIFPKSSGMPPKKDRNMSLSPVSKPLLSKSHSIAPLRWLGSKLVA